MANASSTLIKLWLDELLLSATWLTATELWALDCVDITALLAAVSLIAIAEDAEEASGTADEEELTSTTLRKSIFSALGKAETDEASRAAAELSAD